MIKLYNTLTKSKENFRPINDNKEVSIYTCGPTVYDYAHIGNLRAFLFEDILKRVFYYNNYQVKHVMNITDVGHLTSDEDTGEDKIEASAKKKKKTVWEIAEYYTNAFKQDIKELNIIEPDIYVKATDTIKEQIDIIKKIEEKGFTYVIEDGVYFNTSKLDKYGEMAGLDKVKIIPGKRVAMKDKKNPTDFALWKFSRKGEKRQMEWDSPWGVGFPGWHTECVAMAYMYFGVPFDIHCGGVDHISVHHTNEIAQCDVAFNEKMANFWLHSEFLNLNDEKMSKSKGKTVTLSTIKEEGFSPLDFRYFTLTAHYRSKINFSKEAIESAKNSLKKLKEKLTDLKTKKISVNSSYRKRFLEAINDDLNTPQGMAVLWEMINDKNINDKEKYSLAIDFDKVLGLNLEKQENVPEEIISLANEREEARKNKDFKKADEAREKITKLGYTIEDKQEGYKIKKL